MPNKLLKIEQSKSFKKAYKKYRHNKKFLLELKTVLSYLQQQQPLPKKYKDHELKGCFKNIRECHIQPDDLLLYFVVENEILRLYDLGSHSELF